jgi:hypothetical protein
MANTSVDASNPAMIGGWDTQHMAAVVIFGAMLFLFLIRRGFRGLSVGGVSVGIR